MQLSWEFRKCANQACLRQVKGGAAYCCGYCAVAHEVPFEIHEHSLPCDRRYAERGPYRDPLAPVPCVSCGGTNTTYALFSGGREYYCEDCDDNFPYEEGTAPRRVQMIADGKFAELREEMQACTCVPGYVFCDACRAKYYPPRET